MDRAEDDHLTESSDNDLTVDAPADSTHINDMLVPSDRLPHGLLQYVALGLREPFALEGFFAPLPPCAKRCPRLTEAFPVLKAFFLGDAGYTHEDEPRPTNVE